MANPSPGYSVTIRIEAPSGYGVTSDIVAAAGTVGAQVTALDVVESHADGVVVDMTANTSGPDHVEQLQAELAKVAGVVIAHVSDRTFLIHLGGKLEVTPKLELRNRDDLSRAYTPGVARVSMAIAADKSLARNLTIKRNTIAVVTDGSAVLGLGNIGPEAALPVMEGKAALFKQFANVDAWPVCLDTQDSDEIVQIVKALAPVYGGVNLEDIAAPRCFEIEARLREELDIPVFHDDQHGTAIVVLAALNNALRVVGKNITDIRVAISGVGAAGNAIIRLLQASGVTHIVGAGRAGIVARDHEHSDPYRAAIAASTNPDNLTGSLSDAVRGADVFIGVSAPDVLTEDDVRSMADNAIVFALANPDPEIDPLIAAKHAAVVATGRSDYPNQINNVLVFPGVFRGLLDAGVSEVTDEMFVAAAEAISSCVTDEELHSSFIIPSIFDREVTRKVAEAITRVAHAGNPAAAAAGA